MELWRAIGLVLGFGIFVGCADHGGSALTGKVTGSPVRQKTAACSPLSENDLNENCHGDVQCYVPKNLGKTLAIAMGGYQTCVLTESRQVRCWNYGSDHSANQGLFQAPPKDLCEVQQISVASQHACAVTTQGLRCWGPWMKEANLPKDLGKIVSLSSGLNHTCALTDHGVRCWFLDGKELTDVVVPPKSAPAFASLSLGVFYQGGTFCGFATAPGGFFCWGNAHDPNAYLTKSDSRDSLSRKYGNIKMMSLAAAGICFVNDKGLVCGGPDLVTETSDRQALDVGVVTAMSSSSLKTCLMTEKMGFGCVSSTGDHDSLQASWPGVPSNLGTVTAFASGLFYECAITTQGVRCWTE